MAYRSLLLAPILATLAVGPALAKPTVIGELGTAPLLGESSSTSQMRRLVHANDALLSTAADRIGLSRDQYARFRVAVENGHAAWVTVPRHLDAMSWRSGSNVYVIHDVVIPAHTGGWEVDLPESGRIVAVYLPAKCGNLSAVQKAVPVVAHRHHPTRVAALKVTPPADVVAPAAPAPPPAAIPDDTPTAPPATVASAAFPPVAAAAAHHGILAALAAPLIYGLAAAAGGGSSLPCPTSCP